MTNCKNCKMTDEYCASGDCPTSQSPRNDLATKSQAVDLTEKWHKGEFIVCNAGRCKYYYVQNEKQQEVIKTEYCLFDDNTPNWKILAPVPSYDEYMTMKDCVKKEFEAVEKYTKVKELLKECKEVFDTVFSPSVKYGELYKQIDEVLK